jgi:hypothetical protein
VSAKRQRALTLVIDAANGTPCTVAYAISRKRAEDAIRDLQVREGMNSDRSVGSFFADGSRNRARDRATSDRIRVWAEAKGIDGVLWTDLASNFYDECGCEFSVPAALAHIQRLDAHGKAQAAEYVWRAPDFADTPLRRALQMPPWFPNER